MDLLRTLFPDGEDKLPRLLSESDQAWAFTQLASSYALSGQPAQAVQLYLKAIEFRVKSDGKKNPAIALGAVANVAQSYIGHLSAASVHLRKCIALSQECKDEFKEAIGHREWGRVLAYQGWWQQALRVNHVVADERITTESELARAFELFEKNKNVQSLSVISAHQALASLLQARLAFFQRGTQGTASQLAVQALQQAGEALAFAGKTCEDQRFVKPFRDFVRAYWLLGEALLHGLAINASLREQKLEIHFYDELFQQITETLRLQKDNALHVAERCLSEALRRCRSVNMVEMEPNLLLAMGRLERCKSVERKAKSAKSKAQSAWREEDLKAVEEYVKEAREIAERAGYRLVLADIHLFCAEVLLEQQKEKRNRQHKFIFGIVHRRTSSQGQRIRFGCFGVCASLSIVRPAFLRRHSRGSHAQTRHDPPRAHRQRLLGGV